MTPEQIRNSWDDDEAPARSLPAQNSTESDEPASDDHSPVTHGGLRAQFEALAADFDAAGSPDYVDAAANVRLVLERAGDGAGLQAELDRMGERVAYYRDSEVPALRANADGWASRAESAEAHVAELNAVNQRLEDDLQRAVEDADRLRRALARVELLAEWFESQTNWREWGIHEQIRAHAKVDPPALAAAGAPAVSESGYVTQRGYNTLCSLIRDVDRDGKARVSVLAQAILDAGWKAPAVSDGEGATSEAGWVDRHGDVWHEGDDGLMHSFETAPFPRERVEKKWGPLRPASPVVAPSATDEGAEP